MGKIANQMLLEAIEKELKETSEEKTEYKEGLIFAINKIKGILSF
jgi:hypothetical protein